MQRWWGLIFFLILGAGSFWWWQNSLREGIDFSVSNKQEKVDKPYDRYQFERLKNQKFESTEIILERILAETDAYTAWLFTVKVEGKKTSGQINYPKSEPPSQGFPMVMMLRGYIDQEVYTTGLGTKNSAGYYAANGMVTIAPDFLGYGESDPEDSNSIGARLAKPVTVLTLLVSLATLDNVDTDNVFLWGHSNGGQVALSVLEIIGESVYFEGWQLPATLWAPVSKPFPYSILYYTDGFDDYGKALRKVLAEFEENYDVDNYSIHGYYEWIDSPLLIHQGTADEAVSVAWTEELVTRLEKLNKEVEYFRYKGADHDLQPVWETVVSRDMVFFRKHLKD
ncbi:hypothetical protein A3A66_04205 [Microgenomates group bacterium RIFCSPLOWO2_01_FULL_46_13]|nr:MAG: hypothetical protein A2783_03680 [Microgenomates group bacterium RIFCSPHIGHO2_01_FULL_45_11]OGV94987.1 MAG: hypothetical protein A3A66_04205 [Microgenomates group bacterium RIFCSPLOWO2_01_FULL_46_13]